jgi:hypothetical protein
MWEAARFIKHIQLLVLVLGILCNGYQEAAAQANPPKNVTDFFLLLPDKYVGLKKAERKTFLSNADPVIDIANGYMSFQESAESNTVIALFKRPDKSYIVGVSFSGDALNKKTGELQEVSELAFLRYDKGNWLDVTKEVLPIAVRKNLRYELPRQGTTIKVTEFSGDKAYDFLWQQGKFVVQR